MKSVRFTELVKSAGKPEAYTLWLDPKNDGTFQRALKQHRVLSVHQETVGTKADYGNVGYEGDKRAQILIFPKSIEEFADRRVVGVKYDLLEQPRVRQQRPREQHPQEPRPRKTRPQEREAPAEPSAATKATRSPTKPTASKKKQKEPRPWEGEAPAEPLAAAKTTRSPAKPPAPKKKERKEKEQKHKAKSKPAPPAPEPTLKILPFKAVEETAEPEPEPQELDRAELLKGIRAAMKLLNDGKPVAAYRTLEGLV